MRQDEGGKQYENTERHKGGRNGYCSAAPRGGGCITKGVEILVRKVAPLGDPMELNVRGYELSVRKADAEMIEVR